MGEVLVGNGADREGRQIDLARAAEMQQEVEGALERSDAKGEVARVIENVRLFDAHGARWTAARTSCIVAWATLRARRDPSCRISTIVAGFSPETCRRSRIAPRGGSMWLRSTSLLCGHPIGPRPPPPPPPPRSPPPG